MNFDGAVGPDGFNGHFYHTCRDIIKNDFFAAILEFFAGGKLPKAWTSTNLLPISKVDNLGSFKQLWPINLCNFCNKVISKLRMSKLSSFLPSIISPEQSSFVKGKIINDNIFLAQELIQSIKRKLGAQTLF